MPPDEKRRPGMRGGALDGHGGANVNTKVPRLTGCPCGCLTKPPYIDDPECVRRGPISRWRGDPRPTYDVITLGLACDHGPTCVAKQGAA